MGKEHKERTEDKSSVHSSTETSEVGSDLSRLLQNFSSASLDSSLSEPKPKQTCGCCDIASSLRGVHIRQRQFSAKLRLRRLVRQSSQGPKGGGYHLNLAVAACCHERPLLWPARLSQSRKSLPSKLLQPPRLRVHVESSQAGCGNTGKHPSCKLNKDVVNTLQGNTALNLAALSTESSTEGASRLPQTAGGADRLFGSKPIEEGSPSESTFRELSLSQSISNENVQSVGYVHPHDHHYQSLHCPQGGQSHRKDSSLAPHGNCDTFPSELTSNQASALDSTAASLSSALPSTDSETSVVGRSCSQEVRMEETNVNELASYFEDFLHIPRKMSSMAEMMYA